MATIVPIEDIAEILFDNSEDIPNNIYIEFMNMLKQYHEYGNNSEQIHEYIQNFDLPLQVKLKKYMSESSRLKHILQKLKRYMSEDYLLDSCICFCTNRLICYVKLIVLVLFCCGIFGMIFYFNIMEKPKATALPPPPVI
jgi:hypothetical protein